MEEKIQFRKERDVEDVINATFAFVKQEFLHLFKGVLYIAGPFILISAIMNSYYQVDVMNTVISENMENPENPFAAFEQFFNAKYLLAILFALLGNLLLTTTTYSYVDNYVRNGAGNFTLIDLWNSVKMNIIPVLIALIVATLLTVLGTFAFVIPGIYIGISLSFIAILKIHEQVSIGDALSRCFKLIRAKWWNTLLVVVFISIIAAIVGFVFTIPEFIYSGIKGLNSLNEGAAAYQSDLLMVFFSVIGVFFATIVNALTMIAISFQYFKLVEYHDKPDLNRRLEDLYGDARNEAQDNSDEEKQ